MTFVNRQTGADMITTIILKELKAVILSPKFAVTAITCIILILLSLLVGMREYRMAVRQYEESTHLVQQTMREQSSWMGVTDKVYRKPQPMQIFVSGITNDIGRWSVINSREGVKLRHSFYSEDLVFAIFRFLDFGFIISIVLSMFALLFTYDAVNGERESGTLQLVFSNAIPRVHFIAAKVAGAWLGLMIPLLLAIAIGVLILILGGIPMTGGDWLRLSGLFGFSIAYFTVFIFLGILLSCVVKRSSTSFLLALVCWIFFVLIWPRAGMMAAGQIVSVPSIDEIEGQRDAYAKDQWKILDERQQQRWQERETAMSGLSDRDRDAYRESHLWQWMEMEDGERKAIEKDIDQHATQLREGLRNRRAHQEQLAFALSRISPVSSFQLAAMSLAGTDLDLKSRYEDGLSAYREEFNRYVERKQKESGGAGGIRISFDSETGMKFDFPRDKGSLDLSELPRFTDPSPPLPSTVLDLGLIVLYAVVACALSFVAFLRTDLR
jgi:ABC-type transport system involved in multi-copper enzyme maturation permease subunit